jgi:hypothetical protein
VHEPPKPAWQRVVHSLANSNQSRKLKAPAKRNVKNDMDMTPSRTGRQQQKVLLSKNHALSENVMFTVCYAVEIVRVKMNSCTRFDIAVF